MEIETLVYYICFNNRYNESNKQKDNMKLSKKAKSKIDNQTSRLRIALALGFSETWVRGLISKNRDNGPLTTAAALKVIREETGFSDDEILEDVKTKSAA